jgi:predicted nuclease of predicted toxin-antitoxin system
MKILFDQGVPVPLRLSLAKHSVSTAHELGWSRLENGDLLAAAEKQFDVFITTDQNLRHQQNLANRKLAILVLPTTSWRVIQQHAAMVERALQNLCAGECRELTFP